MHASTLLLTLNLNVTFVYIGSVLEPVFTKLLYWYVLPAGYSGSRVNTSQP